MEKTSGLSFLISCGGKSMINSAATTQTILMTFRFFDQNVSPKKHLFHVEISLILSYLPTPLLEQERGLSKTSSIFQSPEC